MSCYIFHKFDCKSIWSKLMEKIYKNQIREFINFLVPINTNDWEEFSNRLYYKKFQKNDILLQAGEVENYMYFMVSGISRIFQQKNDIEYTLRFDFPISVFNSYASFISQKPSLINVQALSDLKAFRMSYADMQSLYDVSKNADRVGRRMLELLYLQREMKELQLHSKTAEDYYCELIKDNAQLTEQIPQKYLASYLGITPESLSRIKKKINDCNN